MTDFDKDKLVPVGNTRRQFIGSAAEFAAGLAVLSAIPGYAVAASPSVLGAAGPGTIPALAFGVSKAGGLLTRLPVRRRALGANDVHIEVAYCGVCHTDWHWLTGDWQGGSFPMVPGHEIAGRVVAVGGRVTKYKVGDTVGVGNYVDSCRTCGPCRNWREIYCENNPSWTYNGQERKHRSITPNGDPTFGGYSTAMVVDENYVLKIPETISLQAAAPLLCAGITTYSPLMQRKVGPGHRVGIAGFGGLGHVGTQIAKAMGADVTVFTSSAWKKEDARRLGANTVVLTSDAAAMEKAKGSIDTLLDTIPAAHDLNAQMQLTALDGHVWVLGAVGAARMPQGVSGGLMGSMNRSISSSYCGGIKETQEMLDFCGRHGIGAQVEVIAPQAVNSTRERIESKQVRYRTVLDMSQATV
ncbi:MULTISPECIES: NAD(P)-dependent alcohol dehydrogenase [unclassified Pseudomonas]|uniref:NAD(P)-dependent alcohol dehydrogenase n=1 Tax=unclassified Pseudomonas TaxID=196821 RepID=UPI0035C0761B